MSPDEFHQRLFVTLTDWVAKKKCPVLLYAIFVSGSEVSKGMERAAWDEYHRPSKKGPRERLKAAAKAAVDEGKILTKMAVASFFGRRKPRLEPRSDREVTVVQLPPAHHGRDRKET